MKLIPSRTVILTTELPEQEIKDRVSYLLKASCQMRERKFDGKSFSSYEGESNPGTFEIHRVIPYRNSFLPIIEGKTETGINGTTVELKFRLHVAVRVFMWIWYAFTGSMIIIPLWQVINGHFIFHPRQLLISSILFSSVFLMSNIFFSLEARKSYNELKQVFEGTEIS